jgi:hypothetical protein
MSLGLALGAVAVALWSALTISIVHGVIYAVVVAVSFIALLTSFCTGCPCRKRCGHLFPGLLAAPGHLAIQ